MSAHSRFVLDSNVFIEASQTYYSFDLFPPFWSMLLSQHAAGRLCSIDRIKEELLQIGDRLCNWAKDDCPDSFFVPTTEPKVVRLFGEMMNWVQSDRQFTQAAKAEFAAVADGWVIAYAKAYDFKVVTHEVYAPNIKKRVKIPNVCVEFSVDYCNTFEMLQELGIKFK